MDLRQDHKTEIFNILIHTEPDECRHNTVFLSCFCKDIWFVMNYIDILNKWNKSFWNAVSSVSILTWSALETDLKKVFRCEKTTRKTNETWLFSLSQLSVCTFLSVKDDRTCVYMSDWSMTAWVLTGRFWAALPRLGPDSIACKHNKYEHKHHT